VVYQFNRNRPFTLRESLKYSEKTLSLHFFLMVFSFHILDLFNNLIPYRINDFRSDGSFLLEDLTNSALSESLTISMGNLQLFFVLYQFTILLIFIVCLGLYFNCIANIAFKTRHSLFRDNNRR